MPTPSSDYRSSSPGPLSSSASVNSSRGDTDAEQQCFKRLYLTLKAQVDAGDESVVGKKRKSCAGAATTTKLGRGIPKVVSLFSNIRSIIQEADRHDLRALGLAQELDLEEFVDLSAEAKGDILKGFEDFQARAYASREILFRLIPNFEHKIQEETPEKLVDYFKQLEKGASDARGDDIYAIRSQLATWLNRLDPPPTPLLDPEDRTNRGIQHDLCGLLLCPIEFDWKDESVRAKLRACEPGYDITSSFFIRALYKSFKGSMDDYELGFLQSSLLVMAYKHIFTSPTSAKADSIALSDVENEEPASKSRKVVKSKKAIRKDVASSLQMNGKVSSRSIAYAVIQLFFNLWDTTSWCPAYSGFDFHACYYFIIDYFDTARGNAKERAQALLEWWNKEVFPNSVAQVHPSKSTSYRALEAQRAAREG
ncbi:hypothetical protein M413DRAFT_26688 [Hebeloma cylindrosporum]|uniref:Uncharacterized protein n=1 Tax=Hebeloma cylindrosporum TaxID=76867 RepID=A0A0C3CEQ4_HEBCY|nr:hypothetical protein M413DRAFT_26688 [Hebeloma cylindrosporum h7]